MKKHIYFTTALVLGSLLFVGLRLKRGYTSSTVAHLWKQASQYSVDFDISMQIDAYAAVIDSQPGSRQLLRLFRELYGRHNFSRVTVQEVAKIPTIIHHVWMGGQMREKDRPLYESWHRYHPDWTFIFWTDNKSNYDKGDLVVHSFKELELLLQENSGKPMRIVVDVNKLQFDNRIYFDQSMNYGERGDILDYEIIYRFGGVYVDCDFECYRALDLFHHCYDFYTGIQPLDTNRVQLGNALFGAIPGHPVSKSCVENIKANRHIPQIIAKTGPLYFTREFYKTVGRTGLKDIAFPASYFYPRGYEERQKQKELWCKTESYATHHWAGSWLEPSGFVKQYVRS